MAQCIVFQRRFCIVVFALVALAAQTAFAQEIPNRKQQRADSYAQPVVIRLEGMVSPGMLRYLRHRIGKAQRQNADLIVLAIDSPGGYLLESYEIAEMMRDIDWAYTVAYTDNMALSGAALLSFGCDEIWMAPDARLGDIGVIEQDPNLFAFRLVPAKILSEVVNFGRNLAESKGRSPDVIEAMMDKDVLLYTRVNEDQGQEFKTHRLGAENPPAAPWELVMESGEERFLTLSGARAAELGLATENVADVDQLVGKINGNADTVIVYQHSTSDSIANFLCHPFITFVIVIVGLLALYLELTAPGIGVGAVVAALCTILFFWSRFMGGTVGALELILFAGGIAFLAMELFVIPGWGISGVMGLVLMLASVVMAGQNFVLPQNAVQWNQFLTSLMVMACAGCFVLLGAAFITKKLGRIPVLNQMILAPQPNGTITMGGKEPDGAKPASVTHPDVSIGDWGEAVSPLRPAGMVRFASRSLDVVSDGEFVERGQKVKVVSIQGNVVKVSMVVDLEDTQASGTS
ncbi:MAG: NfeD family protein [Pirellulaceae bacterium]